jgi:hypothetical protein
MAAGLAVGLKEEFPDENIIASGVGGQTASEVAARVGVLPTRFYLASDVTVNAGTVELNSPSTDLLRSPTGMGRLEGRLDGAPGILRRDQSGRYHFTPSERGEGAPNSKLLFQPSALASTDCVLLLWAGTNGYIWDPSTTLAALSTILDTWKRQGGRGYVFTLASSEKDVKGTPRGVKLEEMNAAIDRSFGDSAIDVHNWLLSDALYTSGQTAPAGDVVDLSRGVTPRSLRVDAIHLNDTANRMLARYVVKAIQ